MQHRHLVSSPPSQAASGTFEFSFVTLAVADTASAGEPFPPVWQAIIDIIGGLRFF